VIRPRPKPGNARPRGVAVAFTLALLLGAQIGLKGLPVPAFASGRDMIRELDPLVFERFAAPPPPESPSDVPEDEVPEEPAEEPASLTFDQEVGLAMEQLEERFAGDPPAPVVVDRTGPAGDAPGPGISADVSADRFESLFGADEGVVVGRAGRGRTTPGREAGAGLGIGISERLADGPDSTPDVTVAGPDVSVETGNERVDEAEANEVEISEFSSESFDGSEAERLALWMRTHPGELPVGVRVHMNYEPTFLTSTALFASEGRNWELFLMFNESLRELHLVLVDRDRSVYLIDRGFQEQSRSLREGTVRRTRGEIIAVDSRSGAASSDRARDFYNVFLSWWEVAKVDVRSP
jgi:hypothetical protein